MGAGYYVHVSPGNSYFAGGVWHPDKVTLAAIRDYITCWPEQFKRIIENQGFADTFGGLGGDRLKVAPKGYSKDHPQIQWLRYKDFIVRKQIIEDDLKSDQCLDIGHKIYGNMAEFIGFLRKAISR